MSDIQQPSYIPESKFVEGSVLLPMRYNFFFSVHHPGFDGYIAPLSKHVICTDYRISSSVLEALIRKYLKETQDVMDSLNPSVFIDVPQINRIREAIDMPFNGEFTYLGMRVEQLDDILNEAREKIRKLKEGNDE